MGEIDVLTCRQDPFVQQASLVEDTCAGQQAVKLDVVGLGPGELARIEAQVDVVEAVHLVQPATARQVLAFAKVAPQRVYDAAAWFAVKHRGANNIAARFLGALEHGLQPACFHQDIVVEKHDVACRNAREAKVTCSVWRQRLSPGNQLEAVLGACTL